MLDEYKRKRNFKRTPEPGGKNAKRSKEPKRSRARRHIFVIQKHAASRLHYDFRLEAGGVLKSWAVPKGPSLNPADKRLAMLVEDHPLGYASFEGTIPRGSYGAGEVIVWDAGTYELAGTDAKAADADEGFEHAFTKMFEKGDLKIVLHGKKIRGEFVLARMKREKGNEWLLIKKKDEFADEADVRGNEQSVFSERVLKDPQSTARKEAAGLSDAPEIRPPHLHIPEAAPKGAMPRNVSPMLAVRAPAAFDREEWLFEVKWDGYRAIAEIERGQVRLYSRRANDFTGKYPSVVEALRNIRHDAVIDGEIVAVNEKGVAGFQRLQDWANKKNGGNLLYVAFDILYLDGRDLRGLPLRERKEILRTVTEGTAGIQFSDHVEGQGKAFFAAARRQGLEGVMAKDGASPYRAGRRSDEWQKIKILNRQEAVIGGFTAPRGGRTHLGALVLGVYEGGRFVYIGHTGGGFDEKSLRALRARLDPLVQKKSPFARVPGTNAPATWVRPELVCEVKFQEWTADGHMRQPIFLGMRDDKDPRSVIREQAKVQRFAESGEEESGAMIGGTVVSVTHPGKIFWPKEKYTKGDLIAYYRAVAPYILPYLKDRPESLHRFPDGIGGESFFQKNVDHPLPEWVKTVTIRSEGEQRDLNYLICNDERTLVYLANLGCIELNPWSSRTSALDRPDYIIFDLDPEGIGFDEVVRAALEIRSILDAAGVLSFPKTSGATGLHILVPAGARYEYDQVKSFAEIVMRTVQRKLPRTTSVERNPSKRQKRVYLDFLQNRRGQTIAAPYCVRPREGAPVAAPLEWREVRKGLDPAAFTMKTIFARLKKKGDPMRPLLEESLDLAAVLNRLHL